MVTVKKESPGSGALEYSSSCDIVHVNERNYHAHKTRNSHNRIMSSCISSLEDEIRPHGLGLKFVADGQETYWVQGKRYSLTKGDYLLVNETLPSCDLQIQKGTNWGICVDIDPVLVNDALLQVMHPDDVDNYNNVSKFLLSPELFVHTARAEKSLQDLLNYIIASSAAGTFDRPAIEVIYELTSHVIKSKEATINSYYSLETAKLSTRKELFKRLLVGKEVLDDSLFSNVSVKQIAEASCLSEFRFYRLFKQCFGDSPYNYLFKKRIDKSVELKKQGLAWVDIAMQLNFTDLAAFSKSFKKLKGVSPSKAVI